MATPPNRPERVQDTDEPSRTEDLASALDGVLKGVAARTMGIAEAALAILALVGTTESDREDDLLIVDGAASLPGAAGASSDAQASGATKEVLQLLNSLEARMPTDGQVAHLIRVIQAIAPSLRDHVDVSGSDTRALVETEGDRLLAAHVNTRELARADFDGLWQRLDDMQTVLTAVEDWTKLTDPEQAAGLLRSIRLSLADVQGALVVVPELVRAVAHVPHVADSIHRLEGSVVALRAAHEQRQVAEAEHEALLIAIRSLQKQINPILEAKANEQDLFEAVTAVEGSIGVVAKTVEGLFRSLRDNLAERARQMPALMTHLANVQEALLTAAADERSALIEELRRVGVDTRLAIGRETRSASYTLGGKMDDRFADLTKKLQELAEALKAVQEGLSAKVKDLETHADAKAEAAQAHVSDQAAETNLRLQALDDKANARTSRIRTWVVCAALAIVATVAGGVTYLGSKIDGIANKAPVAAPAAPGSATVSSSPQAPNGDVWLVITGDGGAGGQLDGGEAVRAPVIPDAPPVTGPELP